jgi:hypothetical protein
MHVRKLVCLPSVPGSADRAVTLTFSVCKCKHHGEWAATLPFGAVSQWQYAIAIKFRHSMRGSMLHSAPICCS